MPTKFKCKTGEAYKIKVLAELLVNNLKTGGFQISEDSITLRSFDNPKTTLVDMVLWTKDKFMAPKYNHDESTFQMGLNLNHFHKMLKSIKKKDSLQLFIKSDKPTELKIKTIPKENTRITTSSINIQNIQILQNDLPTGYGNNIIVPSTEFQKMCKDLGNIGSNTIRVSSKGHRISFSADNDGILSRKVEFGDVDNVDSDSEEEKDEVEYNGTFSMDQISRIIKITGLSTTMQIFPGTADLPIAFKSNIGSLGEITIYIKSEELIAKIASKPDPEESDMSDGDFSESDFE